MPYDVLLTLSSVLIGGVITGGVSWYYYQRASNDLKDEAGALREETERLREEAAKRQDTTLIMRGLEEAGLVEYNRDEQGEIVGIVIKISGVAGGTSGASATPTVGNEENDTPADQE